MPGTPNLDEMDRTASGQQAPSRKMERAARGRYAVVRCQVTGLGFRGQKLVARRCPRDRRVLGCSGGWDERAGFRGAWETGLKEKREEED
ncbi:hypothetical protein IMZ48_37020 [Candidatus Bathyarchaeota archaeon]|nr:hypothetical protein [Candidatus Bathyarchaeota archaeon]